MKRGCIIALLMLPILGIGQCDSLKITYQIDHLKKESHKNEIFFTRVPKDSLEISFNDGYTGSIISVKIDGEKKSLHVQTDEILGFAGVMRFKRPNHKTKIEIEYKGATAYINYNAKYNMIHVWSEECGLLVRHTNRMIIYE
jgi:hypothetical protein